MRITGECVTYVDRVAALGVERAPGLVGNRDFGERTAKFGV
jgi:hypothetical protein